MEVDTRAKVSLVSKKTYKSLFGDTPLQQTSANLCTYLGEWLTVLACKEVVIQHGNQTDREAAIGDDKRRWGKPIWYWIVTEDPIGLENDFSSEKSQVTGSVRVL
jgi:hypothetical protein